MTVDEVVHVSRVGFDLRDRCAHGLIGNPYELHRTLMRAFPTPSGRVLFRVDQPRGLEGMALVLVQSESRPDWEAAGLPRTARLDPVKELRTSFREGARFVFRLLANPTAKKSVEESRKGRRVGLPTEEAQRAWLVRKALAGGFRVLGCRVTDHGNQPARKAGARLTFRSVLFDGELEVTEPELFSQTLASGLGSGKGMGFGLLSLAPVLG